MSGFIKEVKKLNMMILILLMKNIMQKNTENKIDIRITLIKHIKDIYILSDNEIDMICNNIRELNPDIVKIRLLYLNWKITNIMTNIYTFTSSEGFEFIYRSKFTI